MIKVTVGNNTSRKAVIVDEATTLRTLLEDNSIDYSVGATTLDGVTLQTGDMDKSLSDLNITEKCYLLNVVKSESN